MALDNPLYLTNFGAAFVGDSLLLLDQLESDSINLVVTSPPFALQREKSYGNVDQSNYIGWLMAFCEKVYRVLKPDGSFVIDLGGAYQSKRPVRSLYNYRLLIRLCDELNFHLAEEFFWYNPAKLPSPIEWVNKQKIRAKDAVNTVWWLSKNDRPKADITRVLVPYSERMRKLHENPEKFYKPTQRPSGHAIGDKFANDNGGAIPSNLLQIPNTESNSLYIRRCKFVGTAVHPARFPLKLPHFFIRFLTDEGDTVLDIFAGSNTTGAAAELLKRKWLAFEQNRDYLAASSFRFLTPEIDLPEVATYFQKLVELDGGLRIETNLNQQLELPFDS
jgi:site-specific DNA-methyltransferase (cytosine-N4-specific)